MDKCGDAFGPLCADKISQDQSEKKTYLIGGVTSPKMEFLHRAPKARYSFLLIFTLMNYNAKMGVLKERERKKRGFYSVHEKP